ncbi:MAG: hypothetical protein OXB84_06575 [Halobacteriovoraceae bacterium]|nr:hypothetical protein [Halobacteriovoraceae bacterium]
MGQKTVFLQENKFKNIKISSKYIPGMKSGSEFIDIFRKNERLFLFISYCDSYSDSSTLLSHYEKLRKTKDISHLLVTGLIDEINSGNKDSPKNIQLFAIQINSCNLKADGYSFGKAEIISNGKNLLKENQLSIKGQSIDKAKFAFTVNKKIIIISPGLLKNFQESSTKEDLYKVIQNNKSSSNEDLAFHVFDMLQKNRDDEFLEYDGSLFLVETR